MKLRGVARSPSSRGRLALALLVAAAGCSAAPPAREGPSPAAKPAAPAERILAEAVWPGTRTAVQVLRVERVEPAVLMVRLAVVNRDPTAAARVAGLLAGAGEDGTLAGVYLMDDPPSKKYFVVRDAADRPQCTTGLAEIPPGGRLEAWGRFAGPPAEATTVTVQVPALVPFRGLPITQPEGGVRRTDEHR